MRIALAVLSLLGAIGVSLSQGARAAVVQPAAIKYTTSAALPIQEVRYRHRHHWRRYYYVKCYHELVIGPYRCHRFGRWWW
jgi:hypothetical protein